MGIAVHNLASADGADEVSSDLAAAVRQTAAGILGTTVQMADLVIPFVAGGFMYIGAVAVLPTLLEDSKSGKQALREFGAMAFGVLCMFLVACVLSLYSEPLRILIIQMQMERVDCFAFCRILEQPDTWMYLLAFNSLSGNLADFLPRSPSYREAPRDPSPRIRRKPLSATAKIGTRLATWRCPACGITRSNSMFLFA